MTKTLLSTLALAAVLMTNPTLAASPDAPTKIVLYDDLDLASSKGQARLGERLRRAVKQVCGNPDPRDLRARSEVYQCRHDATERAEQAREQAIAAYNERGPRLADRHEIARLEARWALTTPPRFGIPRKIRVALPTAPRGLANPSERRSFSVRLLA